MSYGMENTSTTTPAIPYTMTGAFVYDSLHFSTHNASFSCETNLHPSYVYVYMYVCSIMSDMLAGQWYSRVCGMEDLVPQHMISSSIREIFQRNVIGLSRSAGVGDITGDASSNSLLLGAVNGMRPDGEVDSSCLQSREIWTGTTYGLSALMIHESNKLTAQNSSQNEPPTMISEYIKSTQKETLLHMGFSTAQVIYD